MYAYCGKTGDEIIKFPAGDKQKRSPGFTLPFMEAIIPQVGDTTADFPK